MFTLDYKRFSPPSVSDADPYHHAVSVVPVVLRDATDGLPLSSHAKNKL